ncbi:hypothetical protein V8G54_023191, partial [Vigna mungo]
PELKIRNTRTSKQHLISKPNSSKTLRSRFLNGIDVFPTARTHDRNEFGKKKSSRKTRKSKPSITSLLPRNRLRTEATTPQTQSTLLLHDVAIKQCLSHRENVA